MLKVNVTP